MRAIQPFFELGEVVGRDLGRLALLAEDGGEAVVPGRDTPMSGRRAGGAREEGGGEEESALPAVGEREGEAGRLDFLLPPRVEGELRLLGRGGLLTLLRS